MNIYLIGFMGCGKSAVSRHLGKALKRKVLDTDRMIMQDEGMTIPEIFEKYGETYFRNAETNMLKKIASQEDCVVSCGGGLALSPENRRLMRESGKVILLSASPEETWRRIGNNPKRPLIRGKRGARDLIEMMEERRPYYEAAADLTVETDRMSIKKVNEYIIKKIRSGE